jgi:hypothetical protein
LQLFSDSATFLMQRLLQRGVLGLINSPEINSHIQQKQHNILSDIR